jgi:rare lipoprotein A
MILGLAALLAAPSLPARANGSKSSMPPIQIEQTEGGEAVIVQEGKASFYGQGFHGKKTASGERFDQNRPTAASRELPLGTKATVTHQENGRSIEVIINDRGPYVGGRVIDLSQGAARKLDMIKEGVAPVRVEAKPSEQPTEQAREKVEDKVEQATGGDQVLSGRSGDDRLDLSGSGE